MDVANCRHNHTIGTPGKCGLVAQNGLVSGMVQASGADPMSWGPETHAYRVAARGVMIRSWGRTGTL